MFIDYATAQQVFVCSSPSCNHKDETCSSYIESDGYTVFPAVYGNTILLVYNSLNQWGNAPQASKIEKMDINGLDRKLLCTFSGNILINDGAVVGDGRIISVSYTHLDVYKRQMLLLSGLIRLTVINSGL